MSTTTTSLKKGAYFVREYKSTSQIYCIIYKEEALSLSLPVQTRTETKNTSIWITDFFSLLVRDIKTTGHG